VVYTQAVARAASVVVPVDPAPMAEYPAAPLELARMVLADASIHRCTPVPDELHAP
jgi:hypothetical protein